ALTGDPVHRADVEAVALVDPMRDVRRGRGADRIEEEREQCGGADAVHVVVAVERDLLPADDGAGEPLDGCGHSLHPEGVREIAQLVREEAARLLWVSEAPGHQDTGGERVDSELDRETSGGAALGLDVSISTRKHPAQLRTPSSQTPVVSSV